MHNANATKPYHLEALAELERADAASATARMIYQSIDSPTSPEARIAHKRWAVACRAAARAFDHAIDCGAIYRPYWHCRYDAYARNPWTGAVESTWFVGAD